MSAGAFNLLKYETNNGNVAIIRAQPETALLTMDGAVNASGSGTLTPGVGYAKVSGSRRGYGLHARKVTIRFLTLPAAGGYLIGSTISLPVFLRATWDTYTPGDEGTYLGGTIRFVGKSEEKRK